MGFLDWLTGKHHRQLEADASAEKVRQDQRQLQDKEFGRRSPEPKRDVIVERPEHVKGPAERLAPRHSLVLRTTHDYPPDFTKAERDEVAEHLKLSRNPQPAPSLGGSGKTFVNPAVQTTSWKEEIKTAQRQLAEEEANMTSEQKQQRTLERALARKNSHTTTQL